MSPSPEPTEAERKRKRPRTRRPQELAAMASQNGESSRTPGTQASARINTDSSSEPSFLQSLLKEVEASTPGDSNSYVPSASATNADQTTPGPSSPSISPISSSFSSPHLSPASPQSHSRSRPISPIQLSSPAAPSSPSFSPSGSPSTSNNHNNKPGEETCEATPSRADENRYRSRIPRAARGLLTARSANASPSRGPSLGVKSDIQRLVGKALKPYYRRDYITKDEFTDINRRISHMLYGQVGDRESLDDESKAALNTTAKEEVQRSVGHLRRQKKEKEESDTADGSS